MSYGRMAKAPFEERRLRGEIDGALAAFSAGACRRGRGRVSVSGERDVRGDDCCRGGRLRRREDRLAAIRSAKSRSWNSQQRAADDARGRQPDQVRNTEGGQPYKRSYGEPDASAANFTDAAAGSHEDEQRRVQQCYNASVAVDGAHQLQRLVATAA